MHKNIILLTLVVFSFVFATSCNDNDEQPNENDTSSDTDSDSDTDTDSDSDTGTELRIDTSSDTQTNGPIVGELTVNVSTSSSGGVFAPDHLLAIWIENDLGEFIHTLMAYTSNPHYKGYLTNWAESTNAAGAQFDTTDAISGATLSTHDNRIATWNGDRFSNETVENGTYYLCMELTDKNATGNNSCFEFTKGNSTKTVTPGDESSFSNISITWTPN